MEEDHRQYRGLFVKGFQKQVPIIATNDTYIIEQEELYNIKDDPDETYNILEREAEVSKSLKNKLLKWKEKYSWNINEIDKNSIEIKKELKQFLKSLGYVQ